MLRQRQMRRAQQKRSFAGDGCPRRQSGQERFEQFNGPLGVPCQIAALLSLEQARPGHAQFRFGAPRAVMRRHAPIVREYVTERVVGVVELLQVQECFGQSQTRQHHPLRRSIRPQDGLIVRNRPRRPPAFAIRFADLEMQLYRVGLWLVFH